MKHLNNNLFAYGFYAVLSTFLYTPMASAADISMQCEETTFKKYTEQMLHRPSIKLDIVKNASKKTSAPDGFVNIDLSQIAEGAAFPIDKSVIFSANYDDLKTRPKYGDKYKGQANPEQKQLVEEITEFCAAFKLSFENKSRMNFIRFYIEGNIKKGDAEVLEVMINGVQLANKYFKKKLPIFLSLDSGGGDVHEAIRVGRLISKITFITTRVESNKVCASACVLILAAGNHKNIYGKVGIHRVSFMGLKSSELVPEEYRKIYDSAMDNLKLYLSELGISTLLAEDMMRYSSDDIHILSNEEIDSYGLSKDNPYNYEFKKSEEIARCGEDWYKTKLVLNKVANSRCAANKLKSNDADVAWRCIDEILLPHYKACNRN